MDGAPWHSARDECSLKPRPLLITQPPIRVHCELDRKACPIVDLQAGFSAMLVAGNGHQTRLRWDVGSIPKP